MLEKLSQQFYFTEPDNESCITNNVTKADSAASDSFYPQLRPDISLCDGEEIGSYKVHIVEEQFLKNFHLYLAGCFKANSIICMEGGKFRIIIHITCICIKWLMIYFRKYILNFIITRGEICVCGSNKIVFQMEIYLWQKNIIFPHKWSFLWSNYYSCQTMLKYN